MLKPLPIDRSATDASISVITFIMHTSFTTHKLAYVLDSLVRVSRRVEENNLATIWHVRKVTHSHTRYCIHAPSCKELAITTSQDTCGWKVGTAKNIRSAGAELPCPKSYPHPQTDGDTQGKKHHMHPDQNPQQHLHCCSGASP